MLHFPSASKSAHVSAHTDIAKLNELLGDEVWAFSNCRVDSPKRVAEVDWLFYNTRLGTLLVSEWKKYPKPVSEAKDTGAPWLLVDRSEQRNPVEQVSAQQDAVRWAIRHKILNEFFPELDGHELRVAQCVYCPQVTPETTKERLRFGKVYGTLEEMCTSVMTAISPEPLLVGEMSALMKLAQTLGTLFRCKVPPSLTDSIMWQHNPKESARFWERASLIHSQISSLHDQLAQLIREEFVPRADTKTPASALTAAAADALTSVAQAGADPNGVTQYHQGIFHELIQGHSASFMTQLNGRREDFIEGMQKSLIAILGDSEIPSDTWVSLGIIGGAMKRYIDDGTEFRHLLGTYFWKWCLKTAQESGLDAEVDDMHQHIKVTRSQLRSGI